MMDNATLLQSIVQDFHFQRPLWLLMLIPAALIVAGLSLEYKRRGRWQQLIAPHLIPYLVDAPDARRSIWQTALLFIGWALACLAIAGPSWERIPTPVHKSQHALTIVLDLSPSMLAEDVKPSRLVRARYKLEDLLKERKEGLTALIAYAGEAYVITPFTDDSDTIINMLPSMHPNNLPLPGSNVEMGIEQALALFQQSQIIQGDILLISDGVTAEAIDTVRDKLEDTLHQLSILAVGTADGAPIPSGQGAFLRDEQRQVIIAKMNPQQLRRLALSTDGRYSGLTTDNRDLQYLVNDTKLTTGNEATVESEREFDNWVDRGLWLCWLLVPAMLLAFRKGQVAAVLLATGLTLQSPTLEAQQPQNAVANTTTGASTEATNNNDNGNGSDWKDLWRSPDQKALKAFEQQRYQRAADTFETTEWKAAAEYKAGNYEQAAELYNNIDTADGHYNRGNALARSGLLDKAAEAYQQALNLDPEHTQAADNKATVEQLLEQQKQQSQSDQGGEGKQQSGQDQSQNQGQDQNQDSQSSQSGDSQDSEQGRDANNQNQSNSSESQQQNGQQSTSDSAGTKSNENNTEKNESDEASAQQQADEDDPSKQEQSRATQAQQDGPGESTEQNAEQAQMAGEASNKGELTDEEQQTLNLWLRQIEDDPSGLLRRKLHHQQQIIREQYRSGEWTPPENGAMERY